MSFSKNLEQSPIQESVRTFSDDSTAIGSPGLPITECSISKHDEQGSEVHSQSLSPEPNVLSKGLSSFFKAFRRGRDNFFSVFKGRGRLALPKPDIRSLDKFDSGYANLAAFKDSSECFMVYRRFGYLQARLLLDRQDELRLLEEELDAFDEENPNQLTSRVVDDEELLDSRKGLFNRIEVAFHAYASILTTAQQMMAFYRPSETEYRSVYTYLDNMKPIHQTESQYIEHREDLVTLRPTREHAWLDRSIEFTLHKLYKPFPFIHRLFSTESTRLKSRGGDEIYFSRERVNLCATIIIAAMILALLIIPIYLLYHLVSVTGGQFDTHYTAICIGILLVFTLLFSMVVSLFTRAKRHEILGAAAAYCAVLVVFLGNVH